MAIAALALWMLTVAVGVYLLVTSTRPEEAGTDVAPAEPVAAAAPEGAAAVAGGAPARAVTAGQDAVPSRKKRDLYAPPSLRAARSEPIPGIRALGEFTHPALALTGFAFWLLYTLTRDRIFGAIALGVILGAIAAGVSWALANRRAAKRADGDALRFSGRVLAFHVAGAALTLLLAALVTARV